MVGLISRPHLWRWQVPASCPGLTSFSNRACEQRRKEVKAQRTGEGAPKAVEEEPAQSSTADPIRFRLQLAFWRLTLGANRPYTP